MDIRPINNESDYDFTLKEIETLLSAQPGTPEFDKLDILVTLVEAYENKHGPIPMPDDPVEVIQYFMESRGWTRKDLERCLGSRSRVSEVLNKKRSLSIEMIRRLHSYLGIPTDLLIASIPLKEHAKADNAIGSRPDREGIIHAIADKNEKTIYRTTD